jgi:hypothetical protein
MNDQLHIPAVLFPRRELSVHNGWTPQPVWCPCFKKRESRAPPCHAKLHALSWTFSWGRHSLKAFGFSSHLHIVQRGNQRLSVWPHQYAGCSGLSAISARNTHSCIANFHNCIAFDFYLRLEGPPRTCSEGRRASLREYNRIEPERNNIQNFVLSTICNR